ncbi:MAG: prolipoprotein diacylglyceryl transferase [Defluviitaleaceae bacterium]|nr:prolipoprotein diacylglyceryl transferase [Defluviitaleaceae bacterium]
MHPFVNFLGLVDIPVYGLLMVVGAGLSWISLIILNKIKNQLAFSDINLVFLLAICGSIVGASTLRPIMHLFRIIFNWHDYRSMTFMELFYYATGEIIFYGGFLGGLVTAILACRKFRIDTVAFFDIAAPALALAHAIGRIGCFFGGCCFGIALPNNHPLAVIYPAESLGAPPNIPLLAMPLIESGYLFILFIILVIVYAKSKTKGISSSIYLLIYPVGRFVLEFFRGDVIRGETGFLTTSQVISAIILIFGAFYFINTRKICKIITKLY